nr:carboxypeptidase A4 isoform X3 [Dasypus novemcinctus]
MRWILFFGALIGPSICSQKKFFGDQVFKINVRNGDEISRLRELVNSDNLRLNFWKLPSTLGHPVDVLVPSVSLHPVKSFLKTQGLEYSVTIKDLQALLDVEDKEMRHNEGKERSGDNFNYGAYHSLEAIYHEMDSIVTDFPDFVSRLEIGYSFENRSLFVLKFSTGKREKRPAIWLNMGIHAREWISHATGIWTARKIATDYGKDPAITSILEKMDIFLLPVANPDGYVYTQKKLSVLCVYLLHVLLCPLLLLSAARESVLLFVASSCCVSSLCGRCHSWPGRTFFRAGRLSLRGALLVLGAPLHGGHPCLAQHSLRASALRMGQLHTGQGGPGIEPRTSHVVGGRPNHCAKSASLEHFYYSKKENPISLITSYY